MNPNLDPISLDPISLDPIIFDLFVEIPSMLPLLPLIPNVPSKKKQKEFICGSRLRENDKYLSDYVD